ncbi:hypothetical protein LEP1GSC082_4423 [Leptospira kirschneri str. H2]|uniref:Uncharacterized protein n=1 Tax=Leptospira kirschneri str. H1 TaxID=1049966 RepID=A0A0E2B7J4_9LEPT|nr:hypothetical protein LEP1GSC081_2274 [Leptospira kirschneri str. H1]EKO62504.1 hypothetical protein LEP1GSC082_4423 [Leptospira kirschneri str. H2]
MQDLEKYIILKKFLISNQSSRNSILLSIDHNFSEVDILCMFLDSKNFKKPIF